jgi:hypothetical protein
VLIDAEISGDKNVIKKEAKVILKYKDLTIKIQCMGNVKTKVMSVTLGRPRRRWEDNIKMDRQAVGCGGMDWIELAQDRNRWRALMNAVMNLRVP